MPEEIDDLVLFVSASVFLMEAFGLLMLRKLRNDMNKAGLSLALVMIVFRFGVIVLLAQGLTVVNATLRVSDFSGTTDVRLFLFLAIQLLFGFGFLYAAWQIHHLSSEDYP